MWAVSGSIIRKSTEMLFQCFQTWWTREAITLRSSLIPNASSSEAITGKWDLRSLTRSIRTCCYRLSGSTSTVQSHGNASTINTWTIPSYRWSDLFCYPCKATWSPFLVVLSNLVRKPYRTRFTSTTTFKVLYFSPNSRWRNISRQIISLSLTIKEISTHWLETTTVRSISHTRKVMARWHLVKTRLITKTLHRSESIRRLVLNLCRWRKKV